MSLNRELQRLILGAFWTLCNHHCRLQGGGGSLLGHGASRLHAGDRCKHTYLPSSSYSWYSSVKRVQVVVAMMLLGLDGCCCWCCWWWVSEWVFVCEGGKSRNVRSLLYLPTSLGGASVPAHLSGSAAARCALTVTQPPNNQRGSSTSAPLLALLKYQHHMTWCSREREALETGGTGTWLEMIILIIPH